MHGTCVKIFLQHLKIRTLGQVLSTGCHNTEKGEPQLEYCINVKTRDIKGGLLTLFVLKRDRVV
jgi:hypothetical protein